MGRKFFHGKPLTEKIARSARSLISEVEDMGGMIKAIKAGMPKSRIEECAARHQARVDNDEDVIVGVNKYKLDHETTIEYLEVDNREVLAKQVERIKMVRESRNESETQSALAGITAAAESKKGNLLELAIEATRKRATLGEISMAMEKVFGRFEASFNAVSGVFGSVFEQNNAWIDVCKKVESFIKKQGRRPRIYIAKMGQDGHDRGAHVIASAYSDLGFDIDMGPLFQTPAEAARGAAENDVHAVGVSTLAAGHRTLVPELIAELRGQNAGDIRVFCGGVIPPRDYDFLHEAGVSAVFGPGTPVIESAARVLEIIANK